jgi:hypothetical protein
MKLKNRSYYFAICFLVFFCSCGGKKDSPKIGSLDFGEVNPGRTSEVLLPIEFNNAAINNPEAFLEFEYKNSLNEPIPNVIFKVSSNVVSGRFKIKPSDVGPDGNVKLGVQFSEKATEKDYEGYLMLVNASEELKQNITFGDSTNSTSINNKIGEFHAKYVVPTPQWKLYLMYALAFLLVSLLLWLLFIRNKVYPPMTGTINTPEGAIKLNGYRMFYIYSGEIPKAAKQGFLSSLFTGKIGKKNVMALMEDAKSNFVLVTTQSTPKGIRNRLSLSDNSLTITKGQNVLYDQCDYVISKSEAKIKFEFVYSNIKHQQTI